jgi:hypothetical protein
MTKVLAGNATGVVAPSDRLWLLRAVQAEGEPRERVAEALVNLWAVHMAGGGTRSLGEMVRAYAQPVNPRWFEAGDLYQAALEKATTDGERAVLAAAARRRERVHATRNQFDARTLNAVSQALSGRHETDVTDYAAQSVDASKKGMQPRSEPKSKENRLWTRRPGWKGYTAASDANTSAAVVVAIAVVAVVAIAVGAYNG